MMQAASPLTKVYVALPNHWGTSGESFWAQQVGPDRYVIENVPFFAYGLNYKDTVSATAGEPGSKPSITRVVARGGYRTLRIVFHEPTSVEVQRPYLDELERMTLLVERTNRLHLALGIPPEVNYQAVCDHLFALEAVLAYETCEARAKGSFDDAPERKARRSSGA